MVEESTGRDGKVITLIIKVILNWKHYLSTVFEISFNYYGEEDNILAEARQENRFLEDAYQDASYLIMKVTEKEKVGMQLKSVIMKNEEELTAVIFVDNADMISEGNNTMEKMQKILEIYNRLYSAIGGIIEDKKFILCGFRNGSKAIK